MIDKPSSLVVVYHEIKKDYLDKVLKNGLKRSSRGDKGDDEDIKKTDQLLDKSRPKKLTDGKSKNISDISQRSEHQLLEVKIDPKRCYVGDLDCYDRILNMVKYNNIEQAHELAAVYWQRITRLDKYNHDKGFKRPEVMVTYDIPSSQLEIEKS
jgi:small nuclear ribonucleoprotein (snRNP)-like protein